MKLKVHLNLSKTACTLLPCNKELQPFDHSFLIKY